MKILREMAVKHSLLWAICLIGMALRLHALDSHGLWSDEMQRVMWSAGHEFESIFAGFPQSYLVHQPPRPFLPSLEVLQRHNPPLYGSILRFWMQLFGFESDFIMRLPSVLAGVVGIAVLYAAALAAGAQRRAALLAAAMMAISPFQIHYAQEVNHYTLAVACVSLSIWLFYRWSERNQLWTGVALTMTILAALLTHYCAFLVFVGQGAALLLDQRGGWRRRALLLVPYFSAATLFLFQLPTALIQLREMTDPGQIGAFAGWRGATSGLLDLTQVAWLGNPFLQPQFLAWGATALALAALAWYLLRGSDPGRWQLACVALIPPILTIVLFFFMRANSLMWPRYWLVCTPAGYLLLARAVSQARLTAWVSVALLVVASCIGLPEQYAHSMESWNFVAADVNARGGPRDAVLVHPSNLAESCARYLRQPIMVLGLLSDRAEDGTGVAAEGHDAVWLATSWSPESYVKLLEDAVGEHFMYRESIPLSPDAVGTKVTRFWSPKPRGVWEPRACRGTSLAAPLERLDRAVIDEMTTEPNGSAFLRGWAFSTGGSRRLIARIDGNQEISSIHAQISRPDVQQVFPQGTTFAQFAGFWMPLGVLDPGPHRIELAIEHCDGSRTHTLATYAWKSPPDGGAHGPLAVK